MAEKGPQSPEELPQPGDVFEHCMGGTYTYLRLQPDATGYEKTGEVKHLAQYRQEHDGGFPAGTIWTRDLEEFLHGTAEVNGEIVPVFRKV